LLSGYFCHFGERLKKSYARSCLVQNDILLDLVPGDGNNSVPDHLRCLRDIVLCRQNHVTVTPTSVMMDGDTNMRHVVMMDGDTAVSSLISVRLDGDTAVSS
ncbi:hypothetical protein LSAT2_019252, partial [Lamellibrachia satsuma]